MVIPSLYYRRKKWPFLVFLSPQSQFEVSDQNIWGKTTSDNPFEAPNVKLSIELHPCQQHGGGEGGEAEEVGLAEADQGDQTLLKAR